MLSNTKWHIKQFFGSTIILPYLLKALIAELLLYITPFLFYYTNTHRGEKILYNSNLCLLAPCYIAYSHMILFRQWISSSHILYLELYANLNIRCGSLLINKSYNFLKTYHPFNSLWESQLETIVTTKDLKTFRLSLSSNDKKAFLLSDLFCFYFILFIFIDMC